MGFSLVYGGVDGVMWHQEKGDFPYTKGFLPVVLSWFFSPFLGAILSSIIFYLNRLCILRRKNSANLAIWSLPVLLFITTFINLMFVLAKGAKSDLQKIWPCTTSIGYHGLSYSDCSALNNYATWIAAVCGIFCAVAGSLIFIPILRRKLRRDIEAAEGASANLDVEGAPRKDGVEETKPVSKADSIIVHSVPQDAPFYTLPYHYTMFIVTSAWKQMMTGLYYEVHEHGCEDATVAEMHHNAEVFDTHTEKIFQYLQVFTACCVAFAHGANDVANAIGPFSGIYTTFQTYAVPTGSAQTEKWIFAIGGVGIVLGLMTYGYNIIMQLGVKMLKLTPSRGFSVELAAGLTISLASFFGIPVSTTQIIVGCEMGVGLVENVKTGINFPILARTCLGWVWTIVLALAFTAALFSAGAYAPSIIQTNEIREFRMALYTEANDIYSTMNAVNNQYKNNTAWWNGTDVQPYNGAKLNSLITNSSTAYKKAMYEYDSKKAKYGGLKYIGGDQVLFYFNQALDLQNQTSNTTIGKVN